MKKRRLMILEIVLCVLSLLFISCRKESVSVSGAVNVSKVGVAEASPIPGPTCPVHGESLQFDTVRSDLGYLPEIYAKLPCMQEKQRKFPKSNLWTRDGSGVEEGPRFEGIQYCSKCRAAERECVKAGFKAYLGEAARVHKDGSGKH